MFSDKLIKLREHFECSGDVSKFLAAYRDKVGIPTIAIGTTIYPDGTHVQMGDTCTIEEAYLYANHAMSAIEHYIPSGLSQGQIDALGDFCYNAGSGAFLSSTLRKNVVAGITDTDTISANFMAWDKAHVDGELVELPGLKRRRMCEAYLFLKGENHPTFYE